MAKETNLKLNIPFDEALERFASVSKKEVKEAIDKGKVEKEENQK